MQINESNKDQAELNVNFLKNIGLPPNQCLCLKQQLVNSLIGSPPLGIPHLLYKNGLACNHLHCFQTNQTYVHFSH